MNAIKCLVAIVVSFFVPSAFSALTALSFEQDLQQQAQPLPVEFTRLVQQAQPYLVVAVPSKMLNDNTAMAVGTGLIAIAVETAQSYSACELSFFVLHEKAHLDNTHVSAINALANELFANNMHMSDDALRAAKRQLHEAMRNQEYVADAAAMRAMQKIFGKQKTATCLKALFEKSDTVDSETHPSMFDRLNALKL